MRTTKKKLKELQDAWNNLKVTATVSSKDVGVIEHVPIPLTVTQKGMERLRAAITKVLGGPKD